MLRGPIIAVLSDRGPQLPSASRRYPGKLYTSYPMELVVGLLHDSPCNSTQRPEQFDRRPCRLIRAPSDWTDITCAQAGVHTLEANAQGRCS